jgi:hypothetical protein
MALSQVKDNLGEKSSTMDCIEYKLNTICWFNFPPPHHDIYSIEDLSQLIFDLKMQSRSSSKRKISFRSWCGTIAAGLQKQKPM